MPNTQDQIYGLLLGGVSIAVANFMAYDIAQAWLKENPNGSADDCRKAMADGLTWATAIIYYIGAPGREIACMRRR